MSQQAARGKPVLARDWVIHPLQLVEAKEAGAAGVLGVIGQVNGRGTAVMSSFGAALGLDCPVEVVNARVSGVCCKFAVTLCWQPAGQIRSCLHRWVAAWSYSVSSRRALDMCMLRIGVLDLLRLTVGGLEAQPTCVPYGCCLQEVEGLSKAGVAFCQRSQIRLPLRYVHPLPSQVQQRTLAINSPAWAAVTLLHCLQEVEGLAKAGVVFYGINLSVGLSVAIPGFASDMAHGLLGGFCGEFVPVGFCAWGLL